MGAPSFTPGPWRVLRHTTKVSVYADDIDRPHRKSPHRGGVIASTMVGWDSAQAERALADARLIAAAPELYQYLTLALDVLARANVAWGGEPAARALLAKIRGEQ